MILSRKEIHELIAKELLSFEPKLDKWQDQPHAVDLRLGTTFYVPKIWQITPKGREIITVDVAAANEHYDLVQLKPGQYFDLAPGEAIIASSLETITMKAPDIMGVLYPRSSVNRKGLSVDLTGIIDAHYSGGLMIPLKNRTQSQVIRLLPGERIAQVVFERLTSPLTHADALRHGAQTAKYANTDEKTLINKPDSQKEIEFLRAGDFKGLKGL